MSIPTVLEKIVARKHEEVALRKQIVSLSELQAQAVKPCSAWFCSSLNNNTSAKKKNCLR